MARHHIRDEKGNLHFFNDEEYKQYKFNKGYMGALALLLFAIGGLLSKCSDNKDDSTKSKVENSIKSDVRNSNKESDYATDMNLHMNEQSEAEKTDIVANQNQNIDTEEIQQEENSFNEVVDDESIPDSNDESYSVDQKMLKKQQKEERKRQKQLEKEAKRKAKQEAKEAKRKAKEEAERH